MIRNLFTLALIAAATTGLVLMPLANANSHEASEDSTSEDSTLEGSISESSTSDDEETLVDGQETLADGQETLVENQETLVENQETLVDGQETLADDQQTLVENQETLVDGQETLADDQQTLADDQQTLADDQQTLADDQQTLAGDQQSTSDDQQTLAGGPQILAGGPQSTSDDQQTLVDDQENTENGRSEDSMTEEATEMPNIATIVVEAGQFNTLATLLEAADLVEVLQGEGPFTVFAPTDEAFAALPEGTLEELLLPQNKEMLVSILTYHVVPGAVLSTDLKSGEVTTVEGSDVAVEVTEKGITVDEANVISANIEASNGVIHVINKVILPE